MSEPLVSIVLLTRNGAGTLPAALAAIAGQRTDFSFEVIAADRGKINADVRKIIESPEFATTFLSKQMMQSITSTPEAYAELIRTNSRLWAKVIAAANLKIE